jgi:catechol 2,3-dioxygenase-like lactoylglutathione lyase family enzyme
MRSIMAIRMFDQTRRNNPISGGPPHRVQLVLTALFASVAVFANAQTAENPLGLKVHHVPASVAQLPRAIDWYQSVLGFKLAEQGEHGAVQFAVLRIPGFEVALLRLPETDASSPPAANTPRWIHIVFSASDPDRLFHALKSRGAKPYFYGKEPTGPVKSFLIQDTEGNEIEIVSATEP